MQNTLALRHFFLAIAVVAIWGSNFVVIKFALADLPPLLLLWRLSRQRYFCADQRSLGAISEPMA
jgi:hypothetical protein